ncbi:2920_t:CDS:2 [Funneliformis caledonium]|uniref:Acyl-protein thioesterase 1 n=1 Tax=Funneliformis caledonium TaxID=1117310 RepID=A0A9N9AL75_9GLOM|nr:2920_t:CDS:2 [Funneliformis caledonium]
MASSLTTVVQNARKLHTATGLGDNGNGWAPETGKMGKALEHVKFILPNAPVQPVTINSGMEMPSWYDIYALGDTEDILKDRVDEEGVLSSVVSVNRLIRNEIDAGIHSNRIVVGGFSQGAAIGITVGISSEYPLEKTLTMATDANKNTPIFMGHGIYDQVVPFRLGKLSHDLIKSKGYPITFKTYNIQHSSYPEETEDVIKFLQQVIPENF